MNNNIFDTFDEVRQLITECSTIEVYAKISANDTFLLIDIREDHEWLVGHLQNAIHIRRSELCNKIGLIAPDKNQVIVLYCAIGFRSALSALDLQNMGYLNVSSMYGGILEWYDLGLEIVYPNH